MNRMVILIVGMFFLHVPLVTFAQEFDHARDNYVVEPGALTGVEFDVPLPTQEEIDRENQMLREAGAPDVITDENDGLTCFDYYTFQSVQVSLGSEKDFFEPGERVVMTGEVINENNYPIVDGNVFVRVSRRNGNYIEEGNYVIDEFFAAENVVIDANARADVTFEWTIPASATPTEYVFDYFFSVGKRFNLGGLPFSNEVIIANATINVISDNQSFISFDRSSTTVNGERYAHIGNWPDIESGTAVEIIQPLINTFDADRQVQVTYDLFFWDSLRSEDLLKSTAENITIPANGSVDLMYQIPEMIDSVNYLRITAVSGDQKSIVNIRILSQQGRARLNYPALDHFPIKKGDDLTLFTCFHSTSYIPTTGRVLVTVTDENDNEIAHVGHDGMIDHEMNVIAKTVQAHKDHEYIRLTAEIYDADGALVEQYKTVYDCNDLNVCKDPSQRLMNISVKDILLIVFISIPIVVAIYLTITRKKK